MWILEGVWSVHAVRGQWVLPSVTIKQYIDMTLTYYLTLSLMLHRDLPYKCTLKSLIRGVLTMKPTEFSGYTLNYN